MDAVFAAGPRNRSGLTGKTPQWPPGSRVTDYLIAGFYALALLVIALFELEQLTVADPASFSYPAWPPAPLVDLMHWWGRNFHEGLWERPAWYRLTIWLDVFISAPVYLAGIYAFLRRKAWIRYPAIIQASMLLAVVLVSAGAEVCGSYDAGSRVVAVLSMVPWALMPVVIIRRCLAIGRYSVV